MVSGKTREKGGGEINGEIERSKEAKRPENDYIEPAVEWRMLWLIAKQPTPDENQVIAAVSAEADVISTLANSVKALPVTEDEIRRATVEDRLLQLVSTYIRGSWPKTITDPSLQCFYNRRRSVDSQRMSSSRRRRDQKQSDDLRTVFEMFDFQQPPQQPPDREHARPAEPSQADEQPKHVRRTRRRPRTPQHRTATKDVR
uniref:Uncharacterized protein n=1 Tax=Ascaris lumbricoides TaxID=6252 RepID=A0A0M3HF09_ASCLU